MFFNFFHSTNSYLSFGKRLCKLLYKNHYNWYMPNYIHPCSCLYSQYYNIPCSIMSNFLHNYLYKSSGNLDNNCITCISIILHHLHKMIDN